MKRRMEVSFQTREAVILIVDMKDAATHVITGTVFVDRPTARGIQWVFRLPVIISGWWARIVNRLQLRVAMRAPFVPTGDPSP